MGSGAGPAGEEPQRSGARLEELQRQGVGFRSLRESIDTTTAAGKLQFHVLSALAEFERELSGSAPSRGGAGPRATREGGRRQ